MEQLLEQSIEIKQEQPNAILYGKKTIGFPFALGDLEAFVELHRNDKQGYMGQYCLKKMTLEQAKEYILDLILKGELSIWTIYTKNGKASQRAGFAYLFDVTDFTASVGGIMDMEFARGLTKQMRRDKYTYAEDAFRSLIRFCFDKIGVLRVQSNILEINRRSMALDLRVGFKREGILRKAFKLDDNYVNIHLFGLLKEEFEK